MASRRRDPRLEARWREVLVRHEASGLSVRAFCQQESLTEAMFYAGRRTIGERDREGERRESPAFVPAVVDTMPAQATSISIELSGGCVLRLPESTSADRLAELVHALQSRAAQ